MESIKKAQFQINVMLNNETKKIKEIVKVKKNIAIKKIKIKFDRKKLMMKL
jgi:hypothetical protein